MHFGLAISRVTTPLILSLVFFLVFTPAGLIMRLTGHDPMQRRLSADAASYREPSRTPPRPNVHEPRRAEVPTRSRRVHGAAPPRSDCLKMRNPPFFPHAQSRNLLMLDLIKDLWGFMRERKKFWLAPIIIVMLLLGVLIVLAQGSAVAPFIYTLF
jgi:hypothetical protein